MATSTHRLSSVGFWRAYAITLRPYLFFVSGAAGLVGLALTRLPAPPFLAAFAAFFFSYGLGQALTDVFQRDTDALSAPYRPLVRGELAPGPVLAVPRMRDCRYLNMTEYSRIWTSRATARRGRVRMQPPHP